MAPDNRSCARTIDVNVARLNLGFGAINIGRAAGEKSGRERVIGTVRNIEGFIEVAHFDDAQHGAENLLTGDSHVWFHVSKNGRRNEIAFWRHLLRLIGERRLALADLDIVENAPVSSLIDHRTNRDSWLGRIPDPQIRRCGKQTYHHAIIIFLEKNEP